MTCRDIQNRLADALDAEPSPYAPEVEAHLAHCTTCRAVADEAREGLTALASLDDEGDDQLPPPVDVRSVLALGRGPAAGPGRSMRILRTATRVAAALLAAVGCLALFGTRVEAADGELRIAFALPGGQASARPAITPAEREALRDVLDPAARARAVEQAMEPALADLADWLMTRDARLDGALGEITRWNELRADGHAFALSEEIANIREGLLLTRRIQDEMVDRVAALPVLRDAR